MFGMRSQRRISPHLKASSKYSKNTCLHSKNQIKNSIKPKMKKIIMNDQPTLVDKLQREQTVKNIASNLMLCSPPLVLGIHGDWGAGKTSFLRQLQYHLDGKTDSPHAEKPTGLKGGAYEKNIVTVWFDAWRYQYEQVPIVALLQTIRDELSFFAKVKNKTSKLSSISISSILSSITDITKIIQIEGLSKTITQHGEQWEKAHLAERLQTDNIRKTLEQAISELLGNNNRRIVIFIDDLDRCDGEMATKLLDSLKVYLDINNCIFVLGVNQQAVQDAISSKLGSDNSKKASAYLEKICQNVWRLPLIKEPSKLLCQWIQDDAISISLNTILIGTGEADLQLLPPNPRKLKGLANLINRNTDGLYNLLKSLENSNSLDPLNENHINTLKMWVITLYSYQYFSDFFIKWRYSPGLYDILKQWILGEINQREYFQDIILPNSYQALRDTPTPAHQATSNFPDPGDSHVLWIAGMIAEMPLTIRGDDFIPFLRTVK